MNFLTYFFTTIPALPLPLIIIHVVAMLGAILISYGIFLETEKRQDAVFFIGGLCLLVYALSIPNYIFIIATGLFSLTAGIECARIVYKNSQH